MVLDIEKYPEFVPWCIEGKIFDKNESSDLITFNGDLKVGKSILNETFSSHVSYHKETDKIIVTNLDGPLKHLKNEWHFKEINNNTQSEVACINPIWHTKRSLSYCGKISCYSLPLSPACIPTFAL